MNLIKPVETRLTDEERDEIDSGSIFCMISTGSTLRRWRDSKIWSPHKMMDKFLLYKEVPRHLSKSAMKNKTSKHQRTAVFDYVDIHALYKKTISIVHDNKVYHIISYFRPIFQNHSLIDYPFFRRLGDVLASNPKLGYDSYLEEIVQVGDYWYIQYNILPPKTEYLRANIDRKHLEEISCFILSNKFNSKTTRK